MNNFYVYVYLDPLISGKYEYGDYKFDFEPFYVGKGKNKRLYYHITEAERYYESGFNRDRVNISKVEKIKNIIDVGKYPIIIKLVDNISEDESIKIEMDLIKCIGRIDLKSGTLTNKTDGGDGGYNKIITEETRNKIIESSRKRPPVTDITRKKHSESWKKKGDELKSETINKISKTLKDKWVNKTEDEKEEYIKNHLSEMAKYDKSDEHKIKLRESQLNRSEDQKKESIRKMLESRRKNKEERGTRAVDASS